jgi:UDP-N-acetyl-D-glucosamine dehydrogenase
MSGFEILRDKIGMRQIKVGVIGLGYVGLPLAQCILAQGQGVIGVDIDGGKIEALAGGRVYIDGVDEEAIAQTVSSGLFEPTEDFSRLTDADAIIICVPTPLDERQEPDLSYVEGTARSILPALRVGHLVVLESTTYPGTMRDIVQPILEESGLALNRDFFIAYSPEREDPGNKKFSTRKTPKVVGANTPEARELVRSFYEIFIERVVPVSSMEVAEAAKITENVFRAVNIALVNELKIIFDSMGIDVWEVIEAAKTKPFGFMPFYPGPGIGGHCIPIDPIYLTWKAREHGVSTRFIELASEINVSMTDYIIAKLDAALSARDAALEGSGILVIGVAYKKNVNDQRESPAFPLIEKLEDLGAKVDFHDPFVPEIGASRHHPRLRSRKSADIGEAGSYSAVIIVTDHDGIDYARLAETAPLIVDTRNALASRGIAASGEIIRA